MAKRKMKVYNGVDWDVYSPWIVNDVKISTMSIPDNSEIVTNHWSDMKICRFGDYLVTIGTSSTTAEHECYIKGSNNCSVEAFRNVFPIQTFAIQAGSHICSNGIDSVLITQKSYKCYKIVVNGSNYVAEEITLLFNDNNYQGCVYCDGLWIIITANRFIYSWDLVNWDEYIFNTASGTNKNIYKLPLTAYYDSQNIYILAVDKDAGNIFEAKYNKVLGGFSEFKQTSTSSFMVGCGRFCEGYGIATQMTNGEIFIQHGEYGCFQSQQFFKQSAGYIGSKKNTNTLVEFKTQNDDSKICLVCSNGQNYPMIFTYEVDTEENIQYRLFEKQISPSGSGQMYTSMSDGDDDSIIVCAYAQYKSGSVNFTCSNNYLNWNEGSAGVVTKSINGETVDLLNEIRSKGGVKIEEPLTYVVKGGARTITVALPEGFVPTKVVLTGGGNVTKYKQIYVEVYKEKNSDGTYSYWYTLDGYNQIYTSQTSSFYMQELESQTNYGLFGTLRTTDMSADELTGVGGIYFYDVNYGQSGTSNIRTSSYSLDLNKLTIKNAQNESQTSTQYNFPEIQIEVKVYGRNWYER